jgi:hypothetical protein
MSRRGFDSLTASDELRHERRADVAGGAEDENLV